MYHNSAFTKHRDPSRSPAATVFKSMFSPAQHNSTFTSNYIEFPRTGMKVVMHEASNIPWECVMFQTGAHAILSTRGFCDNAPKKRTIQANVLYRLAIFRMRKLPLSLRPASINYLILKGLIILFFFLSPLIMYFLCQKEVWILFWKKKQ